MDVTKPDPDNVVQVVEVKSKDDSNDTSNVIVRLTPTGKVSHAKTRVYTQRYRKEWEQMPDFKDWLTSVPYEATRAFCKFCQRNLHAHRLSLLKHMCTLKHQRAAVQYVKRQSTVNNMQVKKEPDDTEYIIERYDDDNNDHDIDDDDDDDDDEDDDDGDDDDNMNYDCERYGPEDGEIISVEDEEQQQAVNELENENPVAKKICFEKVQSQDTLAKAIANVHSDFLTENDESMPLEMVVECDQENKAESDIQSVQIVNCRSLSESVCETKETSTTDHSNAEQEMQKSNSSDEIIKYLPVTESESVTASIETPKKMFIISADGKYSLVNSNFHQVVVNQTQPKIVKSNVRNKIVTEVPSPHIPSTSQEKLVLLNPSSMIAKSVLLKKPIVSTYILDTSKGIPVSGLQVSLYKLKEGRWTFLHESLTTANGYCNDFSNINISKNLTTGRYKFHYDVEKYYTVRKTATIYPFIEIVFDIKDPNASYHIPLLLSPYSYSTYKDTHR